MLQARLDFLIAEKKTAMAKFASKKAHLACFYAWFPVYRIRERPAHIQRAACRACCLKSVTLLNVFCTDSMHWMALRDRDVRVPWCIHAIPLRRCYTHSQR